jgi:Zn finger protein HypA/HybF involved in hydrogenase expression
LVKVPDSVAAQATQDAAIPANSPQLGVPVATSTLDPAAINTAPIVKGSGKTIPTVEIWQVEVTRNVDGAASYEGNYIFYTYVTAADTRVTQVPFSPTIFEYPAIGETKVDDQSGLFKEARIKFTQTERMTVILDAASKSAYCLFAPEIKYVPPIRGVTTLQFIMSNHKIPLGANSLEWARFNFGDFMKNYLHLPVALRKDYASLFTFIPMTLGQKQAAKGIFGAIGSIKSDINDITIDSWEGKRDPNDKIPTLATYRAQLNALAAFQGGTTAITYKQRICSACDSLLIFDPNENALFCHGCGAYVQRYGMPPRQVQFLKNLESQIAIMKPPESDIMMMHRAAFCPQCSSWLQYLFIPQWQDQGTAGNHLWYCPNCHTECPVILDRPVNMAHIVICSHCGEKNISPEQPGVNACTSCGSPFLSAGWETQSPMPYVDPNDLQWLDIDENLMLHYEVTGVSRLHCWE